MIRELAVTDWFAGSYICRGVPFSFQFTKKDLPLLEKLRKGTATAKEIWSHIDHGGHTGHHWWNMDKNEEEAINAWSAPEEYAYGEDTLDSNWGESEIERVKERDRGSVTLPIIMIAKKPKGVKFSDWDSSINSKKVDLVALRYRVSRGHWVITPISLTVKL